MIGIFSAGIARIPHLGQLLPEGVARLASYRRVPASVSAIAVWGHRPSGHKAVAVARRRGMPVWRLEDGFIRSLGLGVAGSPPYSIVVDQAGIYYDAAQPSTLEYLIQDQAGNALLYPQASEAMETITRLDLSKYNQAPPYCGVVPDGEVVLIVDQTFGDKAVTHGGAGPEDFIRMLETALEENPDATIWVKVHPDVLHGKKAGYLAEAARKAAERHPRVTLLTCNASPYSLLQYVSRVYVVTSQYGFEALMAGKNVTCFGLPWYAGWGLTEDRHPQASSLSLRRGRATLPDLFAAAYLRYSRYLDPQSGKAGTLNDLLMWLGMARDHCRARQGTLVAPGLSMWKRTILSPFLQTPDNQLRFSPSLKGATAGVVWGIKGEQQWQNAGYDAALPVWRMEDGFLRSAGLGSHLHPPLSLVLDKCGIYYDATRPSDLETLLNRGALTGSQHERAAALRRRLLAARLSKYNLGAAFSRPPAAAGKRLLLVPGQVEDDASILTGTVGICSNSALLRTVRERNPDAYILYKPHPDVLAGNRKGAIAAQDVARWANEMVLDADIIHCIRAADEVHTLTSLAGFEALMHGKPVTCYGIPFYAGWGLTQDEYPCSRRTRKITLDELVYQALIRYPSYIHPATGKPITAEAAATYLEMLPRGEMFIAKRKFSSAINAYKKIKMLIKVKLNYNAAQHL
ncbi:beta-3-deoxy-D-manno-oct-2-ulosonic acid transferase [Chimaeribacter californicus]|uniref:Beta-3-deoxy-D-manno-oct-2-ulosonic acid transferase n=1 Tax=Chimaeribacter californicus TaxID=2060067 RepID=A0A2N5DZ77_9GAMM|nr:capsular polysaccharide biosynthesis protein [Chimaeribacter californicus]PLR33042.1 beta-3-deoxy-D-manno-oct-2-ulosonic acid transferase [Chimaeribacter californicus]